MSGQEQFKNIFSALEPSQSTIQEVLQMKKLSEITQALGLTQNQIGLYIKENLIHPAHDVRKHFESGVLTQREVQQLRAVQCLRIHEFGLEEIKYLTVCAEASHDYLRQKSEKKMILYSKKEDVLSAVAVLQGNAPEGGERESLRREIRRYHHLSQLPNEKQTIMQKHGSAMALSAIVLALLAYLLSQLSRPAARVMAILALLGIGGLIAFVSGIVYLVRKKPPKEYSCKTVAVIEKINRVTEFDASFAIGKSVVPGSGFREQGQGGVWQFVFMLWNEIRPDHYFPILKLSHNGKERIATFRFGGFKHAWKAGDTIPVYLSETDNGIVYPENTSYLVKKSVLALCAAVLLCGVFCIGIGPVTRAANHAFVVYNMKEILFGLERDVYEGTETATSKDILLEFTHFTGSKKLALECQKGDCIYLETQNTADGHDIRFRADMKPELGFIRPDQYRGNLLSESKAVYSIAEDGIYYLNVGAYQASGRVRASVFPGKKLAEQAGNALNALADSQTLALKGNTRLVKKDVTGATATLYYDHGRYYQRTEEKQNKVINVQEMLFDGSTGWMRLQGQEWITSEAVTSELELLSELRQHAQNLILHPECYYGISYMEGSFLCSMTSDFLESLSTDDTMGNLYALIDESSGKASFFRCVYGFLGGGDVTASIEVMEDVDPAAEIDRVVSQLSSQ